MTASIPRQFAACSAFQRDGVRTVASVAWLELPWCADTPQCGQPFLAFDHGGANCPYCEEVVHHTADGTVLATLWDVADAINEAVAR